MHKLLQLLPCLATVSGMKKSFLIPFFSLALFATGCGGSDETATTISTVKETVTETASGKSSTQSSTEETSTEETTAEVATIEAAQHAEPQTENQEAVQPATENQQQASTAQHQCADDTWVEFAALCKESNPQPPVQAPNGPSAECPAYLCGYGNDANGNRNKSSGEIQTQYGCEQGYITDPQVCGAVGR